ncbi:MAG TPA: fibronectin type III domain-containing protein, partial [Candidatus Woesebacteria bacterium]|nr:fibronectin type III domain-containing protein [Candidatus Woesebacteria bacterium]
GVFFPNSNNAGVQSYSIYHLKPNTIYSFRIRAAHDCTAGAWSSIEPAKTTNQEGFLKKFFKYFKLSNN